MQFRFLTALIVFIGSYLPLGLILLAQNFDFAATGKQFCWPVNEAECTVPIKSPIFSVGLFILTLLCFGVTLIALRAIRPSIDVEVTEAEYVPTDLMNYTLPYVVSFMSIDYQETGKFIGFLVFLAWMFWITHRAGQIILNPVLIAMGWRLYTISYRFAGSQKVFKTSALSKGHLIPGLHKQYPLQEIQIIKSEDSD
ncbi:hypothetical protein SAMN05518668_109176 [Sphingobium sp. YR657]|uniref:hypothetical protein n=1 Tax=Sphingobium sp. YR657 TaxID=1884366 RepID=UPI0009139299|nr:hypothetical protein [Sphingobium sp. YR657]SHM44885.1 hypothetical protein SAMN05518668_109176 [Sphingobium sp. YR657]